MHRTRHRVVVLAPNPGLQKWIVEELVGEPCDLVFAKSLSEAIASARARDQGVRILVLDLNALHDADTRVLQAAWRSGSQPLLIGLGGGPGVRDSLQITHALAKPYGSEALRAIVNSACDGRQATPMRAITR